MMAVCVLHALDTDATPPAADTWLFVIDVQLYKPAAAVPTCTLVRIRATMLRRVQKAAILM